MDQDPFNLSQRKILGRYRLELFESGHFYLQKAGVDGGGGGIIEGTVQAIGWTNGFIFAKRYSTFRGDPDGWMVIDVKKETVTGPLSDTEFQQQWPGMNIMSPREAWDKL